ncbi:hypothetical protein THIX_90422 [Thiomonas sp. X19]|nr:hypothetical protein THIX_90422 [Thiomonas sp. X19]
MGGGWTKAVQAWRPFACCHAPSPRLQPSLVVGQNLFTTTGQHLPKGLLLPADTMMLILALIRWQAASRMVRSMEGAGRLLLGADLAASKPSQHFRIQNRA